MVNVKKLKGKMIESGYNAEKIAAIIGVNVSTVYRRIGSNGEEFTLKEATDIAKALNFSGTDVGEIFFPDFVA